MSKSDEFKKKQVKKKKKNDLPVLDSDMDFLAAFSEENPAGSKVSKSGEKISGKERINRHGFPFIEEYETRFLSEEESPENDDGEAVDGKDEKDFARLLDESLKEKTLSRSKPKPMPLKRRLKRYPPPEVDLDLHGFTAIGAEVKARSFITSAKLQGFFTLRIIVGRGLHSQEGPVLPHVIEDLLKALKKENVILSYKWENKKNQKGGAVHVYLKQFSD